MDAYMCHTCQYHPVVSCIYIISTYLHTIHQYPPMSAHGTPGCICQYAKYMEVSQIFVIYANVYQMYHTYPVHTYGDKNVHTCHMHQYDPAIPYVYTHGRHTRCIHMIPPIPMVGNITNMCK